MTVALGGCVPGLHHHLHSAAYHSGHHCHLHLRVSLCLPEGIGDGSWGAGCGVTPSSVPCFSSGSRSVTLCRRMWLCTTHPSECTLLGRRVGGVKGGEGAPTPPTGLRVHRIAPMRCGEAWHSKPGIPDVSPPHVSFRAVSPPPSQAGPVGWGATCHLFLCSAVFMATYLTLACCQGPR